MYKYSKERNEIRELPPPEPEYPRGDTLVWDRDQFREAHSKWREAVKNLRTLLCSPEAKQIWENDKIVEEGKDFRIDFQFMSTPDYDFKWQSCSEEDYKMTNPKYKRTMAIPLPAIKDEQEKILMEAAVLLFEKHNPYTEKDTAVAKTLINGFYKDLKFLSEFYSLTRK